MINTMKPAVAYLRRSTDRQEQSLDDQRKAIYRYAATEGFEIASEYADDAISGADTLARKQFLKLIADAQKSDCGFSHVLVYDVSRFGRVGADEAGHYRHLLSRAGVEVVYVAEGMRGDQTDDLLLGVKQFVAHQTVRDLSKVTIRGQVSRVNKGSWCGGRPPYGFDLQHSGADGVAFEIIRYIDNGERESRDTEGNVTRVLKKGDALGSTKGGSARLVLGDPVKVAVVRRIFDEYANGESGFGSIAERLNRDSIPSGGLDRGGIRSTRLWSAGTVRDMIRNPAYRGAMSWNRISYAKFHRVEGQQAKALAKSAVGKVKRNDETEWITVEGVHDAIVSPDLFAKAKRMMTSRSGCAREALRTTHGSSPYLLSGLVTCARCGSKWQGYRTHKGRRKPGKASIVTVYYACGGYVRKGNVGCQRSLVTQEEFERLVMNEATRYITDFVGSGGSEIVAGFVKDMADPAASKARETALRERLATNEKRVAQLIDCIMPETASTLSAKIASLNLESNSIKEELDQLRKSRLDLDAVMREVKTLVSNVDGIAHVMASGTLAERRDVLRGLVQQIAYDPESGEAVVTFFGLPRVSIGGMDGALKSSSSSALMAGAGFEPATSGL